MSTENYFKGLGEGAQDTLLFTELVKEKVKEKFLKKKRKNNLLEFFLILNVTFTFFFMEAIIHYNIGKFGQIGFSFPVGTELGELVLTMVIFSVLSTVTISILKKIFKLDE